MIRIDSFKAQFNNNFISYNPDKYNKTINEIDGIETESFRLKDKYKTLGLKNITVKENNTILEMSSKYLPTEYFEMININNVATYLSELNKSKIIEFDSNELINNTEVLTCDITQNVFMQNSIEDYINILSIFKLNNKYFCKIFENESVSFIKKVSTNSLKDNLVIYNKYPELLLKENSKLRNELDINQFKNILRFETRFTTLKAVRNNLNISDNNLLSILNSDTKLHYKIFNRITDISSIDSEIFNNLKNIIEMKQNKKRSEIRNIFGDLEIIRQLNYDIDLVKVFLKTNSTANNSKTIKYYKQLIKSVTDNKNESEIDNKVNEIKQMLLVA